MDSFSSNFTRFGFFQGHCSWTELVGTVEALTTGGSYYVVGQDFSSWEWGGGGGGGAGEVRVGSRVGGGGYQPVSTVPGLRVSFCGLICFVTFPLSYPLLILNCVTSPFSVRRTPLAIVGFQDRRGHRPRRCGRPWTLGATRKDPP